MSAHQALLYKYASGGLPPVTLPDTFYVQFTVKFDATELADGSGSSMFALDNPNVVSPNFLIVPFAVATVDQYNRLQSFMQWPSGNDNVTYDISATPLLADVWYTIDLKVEFAVDHETLDITTRLDSSVLGTLNCTSNPTAAWNISNFLLGAPDNGENIRQYDLCKLGTTGYGTSDLFNADFSSLAPFDSLSGTGISVTGGVLDINNPSGHPYAIKACN